MPTFKLSVKAFNDMKSIGRYTAAKWGVAQRDRYLAMLDKNFHIIAKEPGLGMGCDDIKSGYRKYQAGRHLIFYRVGVTGVEIIRILHDSMDIERHF